MDIETTVTTVRQLVAFMKVIADNDLWEEARQYLEARGCSEIEVSTQPINLIRTLVRRKLVARQIDEHRKRAASGIVMCRCGIEPP